MKFILIHEHFYNVKEIREICPETHGHESLTFKFYDGSEAIEDDGGRSLSNAFVCFLMSDKILFDIDLFTFEKRGL
jgi:hypothetical protein